MSNTLLTYIDALIPSNLRKNERTLKKTRFFIGILIVSFILAIVVDFFSLYNHNKSVQISVYLTYLYSFVSLSVLWVSKKISFAVNGLLILVIINLNIAIANTGGIVSSTTDWLCVIPFISLLMVGFRSAAIWVTLISLNFIFIYLSYGTESLVISNKDYFLNSFLLLLSFAVLIYLFWKHQQSLVSQLENQQQALEGKQNALERKNRELKKRTDELNIARQSLSNSNQVLAIQNNHLNDTHQALLDSNKALERYAYTVSHDLKEPLRSISSFTSLLERHYDNKNLIDEVSEEYFDFISSGTKNMNQLISEMLKISDSNNQKELYTKVDLNQTIQIVEQNLDSQIQESKAQILSEDLPEVEGSPVMLNQLFQNLISNAIKFRKKEQIPQIKIAVCEKEKDWNFSISDNGIGIKKEDCSKVFKEFAQLDQLNIYEGQGIGLTTCKQIIEKHKGRIWLESEYDKGTTFYFTLPKTINQTQNTKSQEDYSLIKAGVVH